MTLLYTGHRKGVPVQFEIEEIGRGFQMEKHAARAFRAMEVAANVDGLGLVINTALRTYEWQRRKRAAYDAQMEAYAAGLRSEKPAPVARAGWSTHESGMSLDLNRSHDDGRTDRWLAANASRFGFVNDVKSELWHWTFVGCEEFPLDG